MKERAKRILRIIKEFIESVESAKQTDEQWFLDFEDELNAFSVKDHTI